MHMWYEYMTMYVCHGVLMWICMCIRVCMCKCVCVWGVFGKRERRTTDTYYSDVCGTVIILTVSPLLGNASECPREMMPFHTDNRIWSKQKLPLQPIYFSLPVLPSFWLLLLGTQMRYISGLLAGDKRCWNRRSLGQTVPFSFSITNLNCPLQSLDYDNLL